MQFNQFMPYDRDLAERIRELMAGESGVEEKAMFGGLAFLIGGNMSVAASGQGGLMVRADPDEVERHLARGAEMMVMRGREMPGWLRVADEAVAKKTDLAKWVKVGVGYAKTLPPKKK